MKKEYNYTPEEPDNNEVREPMIEYTYQAETDIEFSPSLTEEELKECMTGDEFIEYWCKCIDKVFEK